MSYLKLQYNWTILKTINPQIESFKNIKTRYQHSTNRTITPTSNDEFQTWREEKVNFTQAVHRINNNEQQQNSTLKSMYKALLSGFHCAYRKTMKQQIIN